MKRLIMLLLLTTNVAFADCGWYLKLDTPAAETIKYVEQIESQLYNGDIKENFPKFYKQLRTHIPILAGQLGDFVMEKEPNTTPIENIHLYSLSLANWNSVDINSQYLQRYSKDLPVVWQDYLKIQEPRMLWYISDMLVKPKDVAYDLNTMRYFIDKYPDFTYTKKVENNLAFVICVFIKNMYYGSAEQIEDYNLKRFKEVLKLVNKDTLEYKTLLETYQIAKQHNFKACDEYYEPLIKNYPNDNVRYELGITTREFGSYGM